MTDLLAPFPWLAFPREHALWMLTAGIAVWLVLVVLTVRRGDARRRPLRLALLTVAMGGLLLLGLRPARQVPAMGQTALLLTPGVRPDRVEALIDSLSPAHVLSLDSSSFPSYPFLPDPALIPRWFPSVGKGVLAGQGLTAREWDRLPPLAWAYAPGDPPSGLIDWRHSRRARVGEELSFSGRYLAGAGPGTLVLEGPAGKTELLTYDRAGTYAFDHREHLRQPGRFLYTLLDLDSAGRELRREEVPVHVLPPVLPRVALLEQAPTFEGQYLKGWLADQGYPLVRRAALSRDRYLTETYNLAEVEWDGPAPVRWEDFDLVVISGPVLAALRPARRAALREAVEGGLGLCLWAAEGMPDLAPADARFFLSFPLGAATGSFRLAGAESVGLSRAPVAVTGGADVRPLVEAVDGSTVSGLLRRGRGRVVLLVGADAYRLWLAGKRDQYAAYWTAVLEPAVRDLWPATRWRVLSSLPPAVDRPLDLEVRTSVPGPEGLLGGPDGSETAFYLGQDALASWRWEGRIWPRRVGWHRLGLAREATDTAWLYVHRDTAWAALRAARRMTDSQVRMARREEAASPESARLQPYSKWWFFGLFLFAAAGLWLEERW